MLIRLWLIFVVIPNIVSPTILEGELVTDKDWVFFARFCFLKKDGWFEYEVSYPKEYEVQNILLYYDSRSQWPSVYKKNKSCRSKEAVLSIENNQVINLTTAYPFSGCHERVAYDYEFKTLQPPPQLTQQNNVTFALLNVNQTLVPVAIPETTTNEPPSKPKIIIECRSNRTFSSARERWWFIAVSNCESKKGLRLKYRIIMTNDQRPGSWLKHFSADQLYVLHTDVAFCVLYYLLFLASASSLHARHLLHETYKLYLISVLLQASALTLLTTYYSIYAQYGMANDVLRLIGKALEAVSTLVFLLLLILLAKGYTVTRARLKSKTSIKIGIFMTFYSLIYAILFIWERSVFDPGEVLYIYESPAGYGLIILRLAGWIWFVYSVVFTLMHYPSKSVFFTRLFLVYTIWFISSPVVVLISSLAVPKYMREKIINGLELFIAFEAHLVFYLLTQPSKANKNFPFHVRTTQIGVMDKEKETGDGTLDRFSHYPYAPTSNHRISGTTTATTTTVPTSTSDANIEHSSQPVSTVRNINHTNDINSSSSSKALSVLKRNHINISSYAFPPGFIIDPTNIDDSNSLNNLLKGNQVNHIESNNINNGLVVMPPSEPEERNVTSDSIVKEQRKTESYEKES